MEVDAIQVQEVAPDVHVFTGRAFESLATAIVAGDDAILVDTLASRAEGQALRRLLCEDMRKRVAMVVITHYMNDHLAGLSQFRDATIVAHALYPHTYFSQQDRDAPDDDDFVHPTSIVHSCMEFNWGRHQVRIFHNPGHTVSTLNIDLPGSDAIVAADNLVGHMAYLSSTAPALLESALERIEQRGRRIVIPGHIGPQREEAPRHARTYLRRLQEFVRAARDDAGRLEPARLRAIRLEDCAIGGRAITDFERTWHARNLRVIEARNLFPAGPAGLAAF